jgi:hypothetical protein
MASNPYKIDPPASTYCVPAAIALGSEAILSIFSPKVLLPWINSKKK